MKASNRARVGWLPIIGGSAVVIVLVVYKYVAILRVFRDHTSTDIQSANVTVVTYVVAAIGIFGILYGRALLQNPGTRPRGFVILASLVLAAALWLVLYYISFRYGFRFSF